MPSKKYLYVFPFGGVYAGGEPTELDLERARKGRFEIVNTEDRTTYPGTSVSSPGWLKITSLNLAVSPENQPYHTISS